MSLLGSLVVDLSLQVFLAFDNNQFLLSFNDIDVFFAELASLFDLFSINLGGSDLFDKLLSSLVDLLGNLLGLLQSFLSLLDTLLGFLGSFNSFLKGLDLLVDGFSFLNDLNLLLGGMF